MRYLKVSSAIMAGLFIGATSAPATAAEATKECGAKVQAAFDKQRQGKGWRSVVRSKSNAGEQVQTFDYIPPASMHRKVELLGLREGLETIGVGNHAWFDEGNGWYEMQPQFAKVVTQHMRDVFDPKNRKDLEFICLGNVEYEGKTYVGYRTALDEGANADTPVRTIFIAPETGLPAFNIISAVGKESEPNVREIYSYPDKMEIIPPKGAPMASKN
jgi:hypothetical protein